MSRVFLKTTTYPVSSGRIPPAFDGFRIAVLSDLHNCAVGGDNKCLVEAVAKNRPDCILLAGDMITEQKRGKRCVFYDEALVLMLALRGIAPVYYGMGNHERRWQDEEVPGRMSFAAFRREVEQRGIVFLDNTSIALCRGDAQIRVTGLNLPTPFFSKTRCKGITRANIEELVGAADTSLYQILLAHTPAFAAGYSQWGADLSLAGHYHGGVIRLPGIGGVISTSFRPFPKYDHGNYRVGEGELIVSSGLGCHTIPLRVNNPPELVMIILHGGR